MVRHISPSHGRFSQSAELIFMRYLINNFNIFFSQIYWPLTRMLRHHLSRSNRSFRTSSFGVLPEHDDHIKPIMKRLCIWIVKMKAMHELHLFLVNLKHFQLTLRMIFRINLHMFKLALILSTSLTCSLFHSISCHFHFRIISVIFRIDLHMLKLGVILSKNFTCSISQQSLSLSHYFCDISN